MMKDCLTLKIVFKKIQNVLMKILWKSNKLSGLSVGGMASISHINPKNSIKKKGNDAVQITIDVYYEKIDYIKYAVVDPFKESATGPHTIL